MLCNRECYEAVWTKIIRSVLDEYTVISWIQCKDDAKDRIWQCYEKLNKHCRNVYMARGNTKLDRHKVAACYMIAILEADPFIITKSVESADTRIVATEHLAITVGLSLLKSFLVSKYNEYDEEKPKEIWEKECAIFSNDFIFPSDSEIGHGVYRNNFAMELYFTRTEHSYNVLALSHTLYLLEMYNRQHWELMQYK